VNGARVFMDVNVPMYAGGREHPLREACVWVMRQTGEGRLDAAVDVEILQEVLHRYGAMGEPEIGVTMATNLLDIVPTIYPITVADLRVTIDVFEKYAHLGITARAPFTLL